MTVLLAVFRRPEMLKALLCERRDESEREAANPAVPYAERMVPLSAVPEEMCAWRDADIRSWRSLGKVPKMSTKAVKAVVRSLLSTVVEPEISTAPIDELSFAKGAVDFRPLLCNPAGEVRVLEELGDSIPSANATSELPPWHWEKRHSVAELPSGFRRHFLWGSSLAPWSHIELMLAAYQALELETNRSTSLAVGRLARVGNRKATLWWCDVLMDVPAELRSVAVEQVLMAGAQSAAPDAESRAALVAGDLKAASKRLTALAQR